MHQYHAHAKLIRNETERLLQRASVREDKRRKTQPVMVLRRPAGRQDGRRELRRARRRAGADRSGHVRAQAVGDHPHLPARHRPGRAAGAAHARAAGRAGRVAAGVAARGRGGGPALRRDLLRRARSRQPVAPGTDAGPRHARRDHARVGAVDRARAARHLSRVHRRPARAVRGRAAARARARRSRGGVSGPDRDGPGGHASGRAGDRDAAARRRQAVRQPAQRDRRGPGGGDLPPAGDRGGGHRSASSSWCASTWSWARCRSGAIWRTWG